MTKDCNGKEIKVGDFVKRLDSYRTSTLGRHEHEVTSVEYGSIGLRSIDEGCCWDAYKFEIIQPIVEDWQEELSCS